MAGKTYLVPQRAFLVLSAFLLMVLLYVDRACISVAKQPIANELGLTDRQMGWVFSAFSLGYALLQTPTGLLADRFGPRRVLTAVVALWSIFTGLTAVAGNLLSMLLVRFCFGAGEAGALPAVARAVFSWIPKQERGLVQGLSFSGMRLGAAFTLPVLALLVERVGWKNGFLLLMIVGFLWSLVWYAWFRDDPTQKKNVSRAELAYILAHRQQPVAFSGRKMTAGRLLASGNVWLAMAQYFCSNFTFFFCLTWLPPYLKDKHALSAVDAAYYAMWPLIGGAAGNIIAGWAVDFMYRRGKGIWSRRLPAMIGFICAALGLTASLQAGSITMEILWLTLAILGADMTLPPSWALCVDIGGQHSGAVSGTMNMAGNLGSFVTALAFPYLLGWTGGPRAFFYIAAGFNVAAAGLWLAVRQSRAILEERSA
jgi:MFS transporter, ACS family, glucarate transporter